MTPTEHDVSRPFPRTGVLASLRAFFGDRGSGAPANGRGAFVRGVPVLVAVVGLALLAPGVASAAFTRPFLRQITGTPAGAFEGPGGVAVDEKGDLWVGDHLGGAPFRLDEFKPAAEGNAFVKTLEIDAASILPAN